MFAQCAGLCDVRALVEKHLPAHYRPRHERAATYERPTTYEIGKRKAAVIGSRRIIRPGACQATVGPGIPRLSRLGDPQRSFGRPHRRGTVHGFLYNNGRLHDPGRSLSGRYLRLGMEGQVVFGRQAAPPGVPKRAEFRFDIPAWFADRVV
jgi:hypothetical protein